MKKNTGGKKWHSVRLERFVKGGKAVEIKKEKRKVLEPQS